MTQEQQQLCSDMHQNLSQVRNADISVPDYKAKRLVLTPFLELFGSNIIRILFTLEFSPKGLPCHSRNEPLFQCRWL
ncbi:hypothetical protein Y032_0002g947 [Ancylostoma ceylanicum]|uniref:Uncharacterized protein n=1 Tax=Ancylostoma ceylanicum TaxID=53326 RepID=A0A016W238_9BILA|nr:hypothetical protein Y032_0002g947 [Ancylostoma ceylanicum]